MLFADVEHHLVIAFYRRLDEVSHEDVNRAVSGLVAEARRLLESEGFDAGHQRIELIAELKHVGQTAALPVHFEAFPAGAGSLAHLRHAFGEAHETNYGYRSDEPVQIVALKVLGTGVSEETRVPASVRRDREARSSARARRAFFGPQAGWLQTPVYSRPDLEAGPVDGPAIVEEYDTTSVVRPGWRARLDARRNIVMERP
jgi:N-methylhydantoinase A